MIFFLNYINHGKRIRSFIQKKHYLDFKKMTNGLHGRKFNCSNITVHMLSLSIVSDSLQHYGLQSTKLLCPWYFISKTIGADCHFLLQGIFPTHGSNQGLLFLLYCQADFLPLSQLGSPKHYNPCQMQTQFMRELENSRISQACESVSESN